MHSRLGPGERCGIRQRCGLALVAVTMGCASVAGPADSVAHTFRAAAPAIAVAWSVATACRTAFPGADPVPEHASPPVWRDVGGGFRVQLQCLEPDGWRLVSNGRVRRSVAVPPGSREPAFEFVSAAPAHGVRGRPHREGLVGITPHGAGSHVEFRCESVPAGQELLTSLVARLQPTSTPALPPPRNPAGTLLLRNDCSLLDPLAAAAAARTLTRHRLATRDEAASRARGLELLAQGNAAAGWAWLHRADASGPDAAGVAAERAALADHAAEPRRAYEERLFELELQGPSSALLLQLAQDCRRLGQSLRGAHLLAGHGADLDRQRPEAQRTIATLAHELGRGMAARVYASQHEEGLAREQLLETPQPDSATAVDREVLRRIEAWRGKATPFVAPPR